ncbi:hypothetical protein [Ancylomarina sp.]|uniref:hypothetical protein n=1 Tax=Ancylomarina sp. TaxID=1970196 RepID=UPI003566EC3F
MKKSITAKRNAHYQVLQFLTKNTDKLMVIPVIGSMQTRLLQLISETNELVKNAGSIPSKTAGNKNITRAELVEVVFKVSNVLKVFAYMTKNENLSNFIINSKSALDYELRHQEILNYAKNLLDRVSPIAADLLNYGISEDLITELSTEISDFETVISEPRELISERKTLNELTEEKVDEIQTLLSNEIDPLMEIFNEDKEFYLAYKTARMIVDPASRKREVAAENNSVSEI